MNRASLVLGVLLFVGFVYSAINKNVSETDFSAQVAGASTVKATSDELISLINNYRLQNNFSALLESSELKSVAQIRVNDMTSRNYYSHTTPDGLTYDAYFQGSYGYSCENLNLLDTKDPQATLQSWIDSPEHKSCLLDHRLKNIGYSVANLDGESYITALILSER